MIPSPYTVMDIIQAFHHGFSVFPVSLRQVFAHPAVSFTKVNLLERFVLAFVKKYNIQSALAYLLDVIQWSICQV